MSTKREERPQGAIEKQIDENLRRAYDQDRSQEIPARFLELLARLREQE
ncbi:NepR family anti-sigma factor [Paracoccus sp. (in: a-proteobacteria)]